MVNSSSAGQGQCIATVMGLYRSRAGYDPSSLRQCCFAGKGSAGSIAVKILLQGGIFAIAVSIIDDNGIYTGRGLYPVATRAYLLNLTIFNDSALREDDGLAVNIKCGGLILDLKSSQGYTCRGIGCNTPDISSTGIHTGEDELTVPVCRSGNILPIRCTSHTGQFLQNIFYHTKAITEISNIGIIRVLASGKNFTFNNIAHKGFRVHQRSMEEGLSVIGCIGISAYFVGVIVKEGHMGSDPVIRICFIRISKDIGFPQHHIKRCGLIACLIIGSRCRVGSLASVNSSTGTSCVCIKVRGLAHTYPITAVSGGIVHNCLLPTVDIAHLIVSRQGIGIISSKGFANSFFNSLNHSIAINHIPKAIGFAIFCVYTIDLRFHAGLLGFFQERKINLLQPGSELSGIPFIIYDGPENIGVIITSTVIFGILLMIGKMDIPRATVDILAVHLDTIQLAADSVIFSKELFHPGFNGSHSLIIIDIVLYQGVHSLAHHIQPKVTHAGRTVIKFSLQFFSQSGNAGSTIPGNRRNCLSGCKCLGVEAGLLK